MEENGYYVLVVCGSMKIVYLRLLLISYKRRKSYIAAPNALTMMIINVQ